MRSEACSLALLSAQPVQPSGGSSALVLLAGSAVNQGGRASSLTAPNGPSQQEVIRLALQAAGELRCSRSRVGKLKGHWYWLPAACSGSGYERSIPTHPYSHLPSSFAGLAVRQVQGLQLHGTGTSLGDPIEVGAAGGLLLEGRRAPLPLLASKSALGHSEPASGIMGLARLHQVS